MMQKCKSLYQRCPLRALRRVIMLPKDDTEHKILAEVPNEKASEFYTVYIKFISNIYENKEPSTSLGLWHLIRQVL